MKESKYITCFYKFAIVIYFLWTIPFQSYSQCALSFSGPKCVGAPLSFFHNSPGSKNWNWDFGGAGTSTNELPTFSFSNAGTYNVCINLETATGQTCQSCINVVVVNVPNIEISMLTDSIQCFDNNNFEIKNNSLSIGSSIVRVVYTWGDGEKQEFLNPSLPFTSSKSFADKAGGSYDLTIETEDSKGCIVIKKFTSFAIVRLKPALDMQVMANQKCDSTLLQITNNSNLKKTDLKSFKWVFDDGSSNSTDWNPPPTKQYYGNGPNNGWWGYKLIIETIEGCKDTLVDDEAVRSFVFNPVIVKNKDSACVKDANIEFKLINVIKRPDGTYDSSAPVLGIKNFSWDFGHPIGSATGRKNSTSLNPTHTFGLGPFLIKFAYAHDVCKGGVLYDTVVIIGPYPQIEDIPSGIIIQQHHRYQCNSKDTVQFTNASKYYHNDKNMWDDDSTFVNNGGMGHAFNPDQSSKDHFPKNIRNDDNVIRLWDFGDKYAPQCTTDTKNGLNVGKNCNFSKDEFPKHWYKDWEDIYRDNFYSNNAKFKQRTWDNNTKTCTLVTLDTFSAMEHRAYFWKNFPECQRVSLSLEDTAHPFNCKDISYTSLSIMPPSAKNVRFTGWYCLGESDSKYGVNFLLNETKPGCSSNFAKVNFNVNNDSSEWKRFYDSTSGDVQVGERPGGIPVDKAYSKYGPYGAVYSTPYELDMLTSPDEGCVKIGIIIGNGLDNNIYPACVDTQYYEDAVCFPVIDTKFDVLEPKFIKYDEEKPLKVCAGEELVIRLSPENYTKTKDVTQLAWRFGAGAIGQNFDEAYDQFNYEVYHRYKTHPNYPGKLVNYLVFRDETTPRYKTTNNPITGITRNDTLITAIIHEWDTGVHIGQLWDVAQTLLAPQGFDLFELTEKEILEILMSSTCGVDTTGYSQQINAAKYIIPVKDTIIHFRDTSILPLEQRMINGILENVVVFRPQHNGTHLISLFLQGGEYDCVEANIKPVSVGFYSSLELSDSVICHSSDTTLKADLSYYYFKSDPNSAGLLDFTNYWAMTDRKKGQTTLDTKEDSVRWDWSKADDDVLNPPTIFGSFPYGTRGFGSMNLGGVSAQDIYFREYGKYIFRVTTGDSTRPTQCRDTLSATVYVTDVKAKFALDLTRPQCSSIIGVYDSSFILDPCFDEYGIPCDSIVTYWIDFGEGEGLQEWPVAEWKKTQIANNYLSNGEYVITLIVEAARGCRDTFRDTIIIPGPAPRYSPLNDLELCIGDAVSFKNESEDPSTSARWLWNFGDGSFSSSDYNSSNGGKDTVTHTYQKSGNFFVTLTQYDSIPGTNKYCPGTYPDTSKFKIIVKVRPPDLITLYGNDIEDTVFICENEVVRFLADANKGVYDSFNFYFGDGSNEYSDDSIVYHTYPDSGVYHALVIPHVDTSDGKYACPMADSIVVVVRGIKADFDIDSTKKPIFCFLNRSNSATSFRWGYYHEKDITILGEEFKEDLSTQDTSPVCNNFALGENGTWYICLEATSITGCKDTICKKIEYTFIRELTPYNVFTPSKSGNAIDGDGKNDLFVIPNINVEEYKIIIVNRWGQKVFETEDNEVHWNGKVDNTGQNCPDGTYYYTIDYSYQYDKEQKHVHGIVTVIREK